MSVFLTFTVIGIAAGAIYSITAMGLVVTYTTTGIFNFAHGAVGMVAAFSFYQCWQVWNWNPLLALAAVLLIEAPVLAIGVERVLMRRLHGASTERTLMVTLGLLLILVGVATAIWNPQDQRIVPEFFANDSAHLFGVYISYQQILTVIVAVVIAIALRYFFKFFRVGTAMRAVVDDPELVSLAGAKPYRIAQMGWMLGFFFAALAGCLIAATVSTTGLNIDALTLLVVNGYAAAVVGRLRNLPLTFAGGIALGLAVNYCQGYLPNHIPDSLVPVISEVLPVLFLFVALLVVPASRLVASGRLATQIAPRVLSFGESIFGAGTLVALAAIGCLFLNGLALSSVTLGVALGIVALSLVLLTGYAGQVSLCQLTFMGVGAFAMGKISGGGSWWGLLLGVVVSAGVGAVIALPALRLRGLYLALATLAFAEAAYYAFFTNTSFFPEGGSVTVGRLSLPGINGNANKTDLIIVTVIFGVCSVGILALRRSGFGRRLIALNDSAAAFATLGMNATFTKIAVFAISAGIAGLGGALYAGQQGGIGGNDVLFFSSLTLLLFVVVWGVRTMTGALLGGLSAALLPVAQSHLPHALTDLTGLVAGIGIILLGRSPDGLLAVNWVARRSHEQGPAAGLLTEERVRVAD